MYAGAIFRKLVGRDAVLRHLLRIGVAPSTGLWKVNRMNRRLPILDVPYVVNTMAIDAGSDIGVTSGEALAVDTGLVQLKLVHALLRLESPHEFGAAVTARAKLRYRLALGLPDESLGPVHGHRRIVAGAIPSMAVGAA